MKPTATIHCNLFLPSLVVQWLDFTGPSAAVKSNASISKCAGLAVRRKAMAEAGMESLYLNPVLLEMLWWRSSRSWVEGKPIRLHRCLSAASVVCNEENVEKAKARQPIVVDPIVSEAFL